MSTLEPIYLARIILPELAAAVATGPPEHIYITQILLLLVILPVILLLPGFLLLKYWVKLRREPSFLISVATAFGAAGIVAWRIYQRGPTHIGGGSQSRVLFFLVCSVLLTFTVPLGIKLYRAWTGIQIAPDEKLPGTDGVRAWLSPGNMIVSAIIASCAAAGFDYPFFGVFALLIGCLLVQPLINTAGVPAPVASPAMAPALTAEREKVLSLLEAGRISAEESADLLNALGSTSPTPKQSAPISRPQRIILIGASLVWLGFFLPWFSYNPGKELDRMMTGASFEQQYQLLPKDMSGMPMKLGMEIKTPTVNVSGGDIGKGLGWLVLMLGLGVAALPHAASTMDTATRRMASFIALGIGGIVLLWLVSQNLHHINIGVILALAGYAVEFLGVLGPRPQNAVAATE